MGFVKKIRNCDLFGQPIELRLQGENSYKTLAGGCISILVKLGIISFFMMQLIAVISYQDPQISSFKIFENRSEMGEPINLTESGMRIFFSMTDSKKTPIAIDPRIGRFKLTNIKWGMKNAVY